MCCARVRKETLIILEQKTVGGTLIILGYFLWVQNLKFQNFWVFQKNEIFWGYKDFVDIFRANH